MRDKPFLATVQWYPGVTRDGDSWTVTVTFEAGGFQPYVEATYWQPAEGGMFEDTFFKSAQIEDGEPPELTPAELAAAEAWFNSSDASDAIQEAARDQAPNTERDPDDARDEMIDRSLERDRFRDEEPF